MPDFCLIGILLEDGGKISEITSQFEGCGIVLGSLLLVPRGVQSLRLKEKIRQLGLRPAVLHPQFSPDETEYLQGLALSRIIKHVEDMNKALDECTSLKNTQCERMLDEAKWIKDVLTSYQSCGTVASEVERVNDLVDVLISRLIELSKPQVLGVVKIED